LTLESGEFTFIRVDHQTRLQMGSVEVVIEAPFELVDNDGGHRLDPGDRAGLGPVLALFPGTVVSILAGPDSVLEVTFAGGARISVAPHPAYEAWSIVGPGTDLVVCPPGGGDLMIWG